MVLTKDMLTKSLKKGRLEAVSLLNQLAKLGGLPEPHYEYEAHGSTKRRTHFYKLKFTVPEFLRNYEPPGKHASNSLGWHITVQRFWKEETPASFGMAKLFTGLPKHQFEQAMELLDQMQGNSNDATSTGGNTTSVNKHLKRKPKRMRQRSLSGRSLIEDQQLLESRMRSFRAHQKQCPLPIDSVESQIPHDVDVTILQDRYPLMLSLFGPTGPSTNVLVAQPRRLACQSAARRVAFEQDTTLGSSNCPIGYSVRLESFHPTTEQRTVEFQTPGVILRRAMEDPL